MKTDYAPPITTKTPSIQPQVDIASLALFQAIKAVLNFDLAFSGSRYSR